ncbi:hypothetical protein EV122DRAFT_226467, partial [Schizophyllum commune]
KAYGIFESDVIIEVLSPYLKHFTSTPVIKPIRSVGLLPLVVAALELAFDEYDEVGTKPMEYDNFTKAYASTAVEEYGRMIASLWDSHYAAFGVKQEQKTPITMDHKTPLAGRRDRLSIPAHCK